MENNNWNPWNFQTTDFGKNVNNMNNVNQPQNLNNNANPQNPINGSYEEMDILEFANISPNDFFQNNALFNFNPQVLIPSNNLPTNNFITPPNSTKIVNNQLMNNNSPRMPSNMVMPKELESKKTSKRPIKTVNNVEDKNPKKGSKKGNADPEKEKSRNASRDYRKRKKEYIENLEKKVGNLENEVKKLMQINEEQNKKLEQEREHKKKFEMGKKLQEEWGNELLKLENLLKESKQENEEKIVQSVEKMKTLIDQIFNLFKNQYVAQIDFSIFAHYSLFVRDSYHFEAYGDDSNLVISLSNPLSHNQEISPNSNNGLDKNVDPNNGPSSTPNNNRENNNQNPNFMDLSNNKNLNSFNSGLNTMGINRMQNYPNSMPNLSSPNNNNSNQFTNTFTNAKSMNKNNFGRDEENKNEENFFANKEMRISIEKEGTKSSLLGEANEIILRGEEMLGLDDTDLSIWKKLTEGLNVSENTLSMLSNVLGKLRENILKLKIQHTAINNDLSLFIKKELGESLKDVGKIVQITSKLGSLQKNYAKYWFTWQSALHEIHSLFTAKQLAHIWLRKWNFIENCNILNSIWMTLNRQTFSSLQSFPTFIPPFPLPVHLSWQFMN